MLTSSLELRIIFTQIWIPSAFSAGSAALMQVSPSCNGDCFVRHDGCVMYLQPLFGYGPEYDFGYEFQLQANGTYLIHNDYAGGIYVGETSVRPEVEGAGFCIPTYDMAVVNTWSVLYEAPVRH